MGRAIMLIHAHHEDWSRILNRALAIRGIPQRRLHGTSCTAGHARLGFARPTSVWRWPSTAHTCWADLPSDQPLPPPLPDVFRLGHRQLLEGRSPLGFVARRALAAAQEPSVGKNTPTPKILSAINQIRRGIPTNLIPSGGNPSEFEFASRKRTSAQGSSRASRKALSFSRSGRRG